MKSRLYNLTLKSIWYKLPLQGRDNLREMSVFLPVFAPWQTVWLICIIKKKHYGGYAAAVIEYMEKKSRRDSSKAHYNVGL